MEKSHLKCCDYIIPNETELKRLVKSFKRTTTEDSSSSSGEDLPSEDNIVELAKILQSHGARNVLVTLGSGGSTLIPAKGNVVYHQPCIPTQQPVVDETGAGDCYRAAFAVALLEGKSLQSCMEFASAAGSLSVEHHGAVPSTPTREQVEDRSRFATTAQVLSIPRGDGLASFRGGASEETKELFPFLIGSRLNSMKDRPELWGRPLKTPKDYVERQSTIRGLTAVDFNYPQHFDSWTPKEAKTALDKAGLKAGAVCLRYPSKFARGAMNHPDPALRQEAINLTKEAAAVAKELGCDEVVVWRCV